MMEFEDDYEFREIDRQIHGEVPNLENTDAGRNDTTALEFLNGKDIQGVPWERSNYTRGMYREIRLKEYKNYESVPWCRNKLEKECMEVRIGSNFYDFRLNTRLVKSTIAHFQVAHNCY